MTMLDAALTHAAFGCPVFPLHEAIDAGTDHVTCTCSVPGCDKQGKHPRTKSGLKEATPDPEQITRSWTTWPNANIAIATGGVMFVIDLDGAVALESLKALGGAREAAAHPQSDDGSSRRWRAPLLPQTGRHPRAQLAGPRQARTRRRYRRPRRRWVRRRRAVGSRDRQDVRRQRRRDGRRAHLAARSVKKPERRELPIVVPALSTSTTAYMDDPRSPASATASAPQSSPDENDTLNAAAFRLAQLTAGGEIAPGDARPSLEDAGQACGLTAHEIKLTIDSAFRGGMDSPATALEKAPRASASPRSRKVPDTRMTPVSDDPGDPDRYERPPDDLDRPPADPMPDDLPSTTSPTGTETPPARPKSGSDDYPERELTEGGFADRIVDAHQEDLRWTPGYGWLVWTGRYWRTDSNGEVIRRACQVVNRFYAEADQESDDDRKKLLNKYAQKCESARAINGAIQLHAHPTPGRPARRHPEHPQRPERRARPLHRRTAPAPTRLVLHPHRRMPIRRDREGARLALVPRAHLLGRLVADQVRAAPRRLQLHRRRDRADPRVRPWHRRQRQEHDARDVPLHRRRASTASSAAATPARGSHTTRRRRDRPPVAPPAAALPSTPRALRGRSSTRRRDFDRIGLCSLPLSLPLGMYRSGLKRPFIEPRRRYPQDSRWGRAAFGSGVPNAHPEVTEGTPAIVFRITPLYGGASAQNAAYGPGAQTSLRRAAHSPTTSVAARRRPACYCLTTVKTV